MTSIMDRAQAATRSVPPLRGTLPPHCQRDLSSLRGFVRSAVSGGVPDPAVTANQVREVLVTGATGFIGRFLVRDLLAHDSGLIVHCIVRAEDARRGMARLRARMEEAEIWDDAFAPRLQLHAGDIAQARFGLSEEDFSLLSERIDAVHHLAASLTLASSYVAVRRVNTFAIRNVLELCFRTRLKHLYYASTLGVFPEYFCGFAREYQDSRIDHQMQPDLGAMKRHFPLGLLGYPWSKLVSEQAILFAGQAGLPVGVFRLPQSAMTSSGFAQPSDITVRTFSAVNDVRMVPRGFVFQSPQEAIDTLTGIWRDISLNPGRRHTIYHCSDQHPVERHFTLDEFGWHYPEVPYETFKRVCRARGKASPLSGHWALLDHFRSYWFRGGRSRTDIPVSDRAMREDCPRPVEWPGPLTKLVRHYRWVRRRGDRWPYPAPPDGRLEYDRLVEQARDYAAAAGVPFECVYPDWMLGGLRRLVRAIKAPTAGMRKDMTSFVVFDSCRLLRNGAALAEERRRFPEIDEQKIVRPLFIVGINRTGTTYLHRLMARDPRFWTLRSYEYFEPVLASGDYAGIKCFRDDPRRASAADALGASGIAEAFKGIHHIDIDEPEEDFPILRMTFSAWPPTTRYRVPEYESWLQENGCREAYGFHRRTMQHFTYHRRLRQPGRPGEWLLKMPYHLLELDSLVEAYPDALFIQTHREPVQFMGSWCSLVEKVRGRSSDPQPRDELGAEQLAFMKRIMDRSVEFRTGHPELEHRWIDVSYYDLVQDPLAVVGRIYDQFGWSLEPGAVGAMDAWLAEQTEHRRTERRHRYDIADYGLTREMIDASFARYREFVSERGIRESSL